MNLYNTKKHKRRNDIILICILLLLSLTVLGTYHLLYQKAGSYIEIAVDGTVVKTLPLDTDTMYTINGANGGTNTLQIKDGYASITEADCPDKFCVHQKKIHYRGETLVCLPHKVVVSVVSNDNSAYDGIAS